MQALLDKAHIRWDRTATLARYDWLVNEEATIMRVKGWPTVDIHALAW